MKYVPVVGICLGYQPILDSTFKDLFFLEMMFTPNLAEMIQVDDCLLFIECFDTYISRTVDGSEIRRSPVEMF